MCHCLPSTIPSIPTSFCFYYLKPPLLFPCYVPCTLWLRTTHFLGTSVVSRSYLFLSTNVNGTVFWIVFLPTSTLCWVSYPDSLSKELPVWFPITFKIKTHKALRYSRSDGPLPFHFAWRHSITQHLLTYKFLTYFFITYIWVPI